MRTTNKVRLYSQAKKSVRVVLAEAVRPAIKELKMKSLQNKSVLISGGSSGIGLALAKKLAAFDTQLFLLARRKENLSRAKKEILSIFPSKENLIHTFPADVRDYQTLSDQIKPILEKYGYPDILINSAGITYPGEFLDLDIEIFEDIIRTNYLGTVYLTKIIAPGMVKRGSGHIVNISSQAAFIGVYGYSAYAPSKNALRGFSQVVRSELKPYNVDVSIVYPPDTDTPQLAFENQIKPEITRMISQNAGLLSAEKVAEVILKGIQKGNFTIIPGFEGKILSVFAPFIGRYFYHFAGSKAKDKLKKK